MDVALADADETRYDIEMQTGHAYDLERRIRFYQSSIDRRTLEPAESYRMLTLTGSTFSLQILYPNPA